MTTGFQLITNAQGAARSTKLVFIIFMSVLEFNTGYYSGLVFLFGIFIIPRFVSDKNVRFSPNVLHFHQRSGKQNLSQKEWGRFVSTTKDCCGRILTIAFGATILEVYSRKAENNFLCLFIGVSKYNCMQWRSCLVEYNIWLLLDINIYSKNSEFIPNCLPTMNISGCATVDQTSWNFSLFFSHNRASARWCVWSFRPFNFYQFRIIYCIFRSFYNVFVVICGD